MKVLKGLGLVVGLGLASIVLLWGTTLYALEYKPYLLIMDLDDTIRVTHVQTYYSAFWNGVWGSSIFPGMSNVSQDLSKNAKTTIYLSGSPQSLASRIKTLLVQKNGFPEGEFLLRNWLFWESTEKFKKRELTRLASENPELSFLLIGDDTERDPETFLQFYNEQTHANPESLPLERMLAIYIHRVTGRELPSEVTPFVTAFDLALHEVEAGRLSSSQAIQIGSDLVKSKHPEILFPLYKRCPKDYSIELGPVASMNADLVAVSLEVKAYIRQYCSLRTSFGMSR